jgi:hypothetical protein
MFLVGKSCPAAVAVGSTVAMHLRPVTIWAASTIVTSQTHDHPPIELCIDEQTSVHPSASAGLADIPHQWTSKYETFLNSTD